MADTVPGTPDGSVPCTVGVLEVAAMVGVTLQPTPDIEPQPAAPATPDAMAREASAKPDPIMTRLAHIMVALPLRKGGAPTYPWSTVQPMMPGKRPTSQWLVTGRRAVTTFCSHLDKAGQAGTSCPKVLHKPNASMITNAATITSTTGRRQHLPLRTIGVGMYHEGKRPGA